MGVFGYNAFVDTVTKDFSGMLWAILISVIALAAGAVLVYLTYKDDEPKKQKAISLWNWVRPEKNRDKSTC